MTPAHPHATGVAVYPTLFTFNRKDIAGLPDHATNMWPTSWNRTKANESNGYNEAALTVNKYDHPV